MSLVVEGIAKSFITSAGAVVEALREVSFGVEEGQFVCVVGPSGCGKTTLLNILAGLETQDAGRVWLDGEEIVGPDASKGMIFQDYALFPWRTVLKNIEFGPELRGQAAYERAALAQRYARLVGLEGFEHSYPHELSGGMRQRVAIARALANDPRLLLMDEPFGALDAQTRKMMQGELLRIWEQARKTIVFVTHSVIEAVYLADRVVVLTARPGQVKGIVDVPIPRPRSYREGEYLRVRERVLDLVDEEVQKAFAGDGALAGVAGAQGGDGERMEF